MLIGRLPDGTAVPEIPTGLRPSEWQTWILVRITGLLIQTAKHDQVFTKRKVMKQYANLPHQ